MAEHIIVGTRGSNLSLISSRKAIENLRMHFPDLDIETKTIKTEGDRKPEIPLHKLEVQGIFTKEIEKALLANKIDIAVHSLKDLPTILPGGLVIGAVLERSDPRDVLVSRNRVKLSGLPKNAVIGTDSPRRRAQLLAFRPDLRVESVRGNIETRLQKLDSGQYDALVLAAAGLIPLGFRNRIAEYFPTGFMLPAQGQGALAIEVREGDRRILEFVKTMEHGPTRIAVEAERSFVRYVWGGCKTPMAAFACPVQGRYVLEGKILSPNGKIVFKDNIDVNPGFPEEAGRKLAIQLLTAGAREIIKERLPLEGKKILITRSKEQAVDLSSGLRILGASTVEFPTIKFEPAKGPSLDKSIRGLANYDWIVFTSSNGVRFFFERVQTLGMHDHLNGLKIAAIGPATAEALSREGVEADCMPERYLTEEIAGAMGNIKGSRILLPRADIAGKRLIEALEEKGALVEQATAYRTIMPEQRWDRSLLKGIDFITFTSASTVNNFVALLGEENLKVLNKIKIACIGPVTAKAASDWGIRVNIVSDEHTVDGLVRAIVTEVGGGRQLK